MSKPDVILMAPIPHAPTMALLAEQFTIYRYWDAQDKPALIASIKDTCTAAATSGFAGMKGDVIRALPKLKFISVFGVGYDGVDLGAAKECGVRVSNTPDVLNECVADTAWALILSTVRGTAFNDRFVRAGNWLKGTAPLTNRVWGETIGIIGLGRIGKAIAKRAEGFGMTIAYHGRTKQKDVAYAYYPNLVDMASAARVLVVITPGGKETDKIVNAEVLAALGTKGYLINVSRGSTVDQAALIKALTERTIAGAGLDVFVEEPKVPTELLALDNVVLQPHVGSATHQTRAAMGQLTIDNLTAWFTGKPLLTEVPETRG
jgi:lactate dehydrogenase-like 2-hydroxyacid dehydrogenase